MQVSKVVLFGTDSQGKVLIQSIGIVAPPPEGTITAFNRSISNGIPNVNPLLSLSEYYE